ncbi:MAG: purine-nucleoside phosphorylase [Bacteroidota bacterium]
MTKRINEAFDYIRKMTPNTPKIGIVLGTGLGGLVSEIEIEKSIPYNFIPHFPISTVESHFGRLIFGTIEDLSVVAMQGRFHYYEGYSMQEITFPIRILKKLGIETLFISNAAGGLNLDYKQGDLMAIDDHINLQSENPLAGPNLEDFGPRFPDMSQPYDASLIAQAQEFAQERGIHLHRGVYVAVNGPNLETRAEYRFLRQIGADVVGMSTVPEVIVARHMGLKVFAISVITDECDPDNLQPVNVEEIIATAAKAEPNMTAILCKLIGTCK